MEDVLKDLREQLNKKQSKLQHMVGSKKFVESQEGKAAFEVIDSEITYLVGKMTKGEPLSHEEYLDAHGGIKALKRFRSILEQDSSQQRIDSANEEANVTAKKITELNKKQ